MRRRQLARIAICAISFGIVLSVSLVREANALDKPDLLSIRIRPTSIKDENIDQVLGRLTEYGIRRGIDLKVPETNVKDFLDTVVAKDPRYTWKLEGGVVHVWPKTERDTLVTTLLDTKISTFPSRGVLVVTTSSTRL